MSVRTLKILVISYGIKTLLVGIAWLVVPDLPQRAASALRSAWGRVTTTSVTTPPSPSAP